MQRFLISSCCILLIVFLQVVRGRKNACTELKCGDDQGLAIHFPFPRGHHCSDPAAVECNGRHQTVVDQRMVLVKFFVKHIDYNRQELQVYSPDDCLLLKPVEIPKMPISPFYLSESSSRNVTLFHCPSPVVRDIYAYRVPCVGDPGYTVYGVTSFFDLDGRFRALQSCTKMFDVSLKVPVGYWQGKDDEILRFRWSKPNCKECEAEGKSCRLQNNGTKSEIECVHVKKASKTMKFVAAGATPGSFILLVLVIVACCIYRSDRKEKENQLRIEKFLEDYKALKPSRYSYADIKRITSQFKHKLGEGAYGTVFKGKLSSELFVAVKLLNNSKGNGEEFVNEVGTMCHIHHVNVVRLVGFCADGFIRALVYEFFPNGSLQDFISSADSSKSGFLGWEELQDIAIGIAKGIEYLHQGCDQRILHFDIKPHNVLLDHNLTPKISDFGLAKLCSKDQSVVSMTTARGTLGYIAPEVFSRNFGNVSYKSDVYSFGMLLLEIVGGRKNVGSSTENMNEIYYPEWIYNLLEGGDDIRIHIGKEENAKIQKKLSIVGLWCIQWHPVDRPSMNVVVQMLQGGGGENMTLPPNPLISRRPTTTHATGPGRHRNLELETIAEFG